MIHAIETHPHLIEGCSGRRIICSDAYRLGDGTTIPYPLNKPTKLPLDLLVTVSSNPISPWVYWFSSSSVESPEFKFAIDQYLLGKGHPWIIVHAETGTIIQGGLYSIVKNYGPIPVTGRVCSIATEFRRQQEQQEPHAQFCCYPGDFE